MTHPSPSARVGSAATTGSPIDASGTDDVAGLGPAVEVVGGDGVELAVGPLDRAVRGGREGRDVAHPMPTTGEPVVDAGEVARQLRDPLVCHPPPDAVDGEPGEVSGGVLVRGQCRCGRVQTDVHAREAARIDHDALAVLVGVQEVEDVAVLEWDPLQVRAVAVATHDPRAACRGRAARRSSARRWRSRQGRTPPGRPGRSHGAR